MNPQEAMLFVEYLAREGYKDKRFKEESNRNQLMEVIELLQRGEKYEKIVKDIEYELNWHKPDCPCRLEVSKDEEYLDEILDLIDDIKQKYGFPKPSANFTEKVMEKINKETKE